MKKIIPAVLCFVMLASCTISAPMPTALKDFSKNASVSLGSFSYNANVRWKTGAVYIVATSTNAKGLSISCDGSKVTFSRKSFSKSVDASSVSSYNPALILYQILSNTEAPSYDKKAKCFVCSGNTSIGNYQMYVNDEGDIQKITFQDEKYYIVFS